MIEAILKVDATIDELNNNIIVKRLIELKSIINSDSEIQVLLKNFKDAKDQYESNLFITDTLKTSKNNLYNHPVILEYRKLYSELNLSINKFNHNILKLLDTNNYNCGIN